MKGASPKPRVLRADKPCRDCGKPIHYTYSRPVEGICGRCTDKRRGRKRRVRPYHHAMVVGDHAPDRRSAAAEVVRLYLIMAVLAAAVVFVLNLLLG